MPHSIDDLRRLCGALAAACVACIVGAASGQQPTASSLRQRAHALLNQTRATTAAALDAGKKEARQITARLKAEAATTPTGLSFLAGDDPRSWVSPAPDLELPDHLVLLVHGLDEPGTIWNDLAPALASRGYSVARVDYPNDQAIASSADELADALRGLHSRGTQRVDLICHSMGGLVARDALTRTDHYAGQARGHADLPDIDHLVMIATPHTGSRLAPLQAIADGREQVLRWADSPDHDWRLLLAFMNDGRGQAADDLTPGSRFLTDLNARPAPQGVTITSIAAELVVEKADTAQAAALPIHAVADRLGDGVVPFHSAAAYTAGEVVQVRATHRGVLRLTETERRLRASVGAPPRTAAAIPIILDRLSQPFSPPPAPPS